jgi:hypothetical protein
MWFASWLKNLNRSSVTKRSRARRPTRQRARVLRLESLENRAMFSFGSPISIGFIGTSPSAMATADVNGDGKADIVAAVGGPSAIIGVEVTLSQGGGNFAKPVYYSVPSTQHVTAVAVADINHDGKLDIIAGSDTFNVSDPFGATANISILLGNGKGTFAAAQTYINALSTSRGPLSLAVADFNGDGKLDIAALNQYGGIDVLFNPGHHRFWQVDSTYGVGSTYFPSFSSIVAGDLNGDGKPDLVVANGSDVAYVLLNTGNGSFSKQSYAAGGIASTAAIGDFNGDGKLDIVTANGASNSISVLLNNGDGTFAAAQNFAVGGNVRYIAVGDFSKDGRLDIVATGAETDILLGNGDGTFGAAQNVGPAGSDLVVADFNGDGFPDLVQIDGSGASIDVLLNNADWNPKGQK